MFILCFLDLSLSVFALFVCVLYGGASGPLRCCAFLICLLFRDGGALALCLLFVVVWFCVFSCLLSGVLCLLSGVSRLLLLGGARALSSTILGFLDLSSVCWWGFGPPLRSCAFYQSPVCWWALASCPILCFLVCLFLCPALTLCLCGALLWLWRAAPVL